MIQQVPDMSIIFGTYLCLYYAMTKISIDNDKSCRRKI